MLKQTAMLLGVDSNSTSSQSEPSSTREEAWANAERYGSTHPAFSCYIRCTYATCHDRFQTTRTICHSFKGTFHA